MNSTYPQLLYKVIYVYIYDGNHSIVYKTHPNKIHEFEFHISRKLKLLVMYVMYLFIGIWIMEIFLQGLNYDIN